MILVAFVLPGFVTVLFQERTFKRAEDPTPLDRLLRAVYYSLWSYLILAAVAVKSSASTERRSSGSTSGTPTTPRSLSGGARSCCSCPRW